MAQTYFFKALDDKEKVTQGTLRAPTRAVAQARLQKTFVRILVLREQEEALAQTPAFQRSPSVKLEDLAVYTRQVATMISAGIAVNRAFRFVAKGDNKRLNLVMSRVADAIEEGRSISQALAEQPRVFNGTYVALVEAGETSGRLGTILERLSALLEKNVRMGKRIASAFAYPAVIAVVASGIIALFVFYIFPLLLPMFTMIGVQLPLPTRILVFVTEFLSSPKTAFPAVAVVVGVVVALSMALSDPKRSGVLRVWLDKTLLVLPVIGKLTELSVSARILYTMSTMLESGVTLIDVLRTCEAVAGNVVYARRLSLTRETLVSGVSFHQALALHEVFAPTALQMIKVGEETGRLYDLTARVGKLYEDDVEMQLTNIANMIEPLMMGVMGIVVGFIVLATFMPMINLVNQL